MNKKDYKQIYNILLAYAISDEAKEYAKKVATQAFGPTHLYSDLGFKTRLEYNDYMTRLYPELAKKRPPEIRWKKFLFDLIGSRAPACESCTDESVCFSCDLMA